MKINKITPSSSSFPEALTHIPSPPKALYVLGNLELLIKSPKLAIIGSRKVSSYGNAITIRLAKEAAANGIVIVSGLALGVDGLAHKAALETGGLTIAVLAHGLDQVHPTTNYHLAQKILKQGGALISEYAEGTPALPPHFIARNRLISGLSDGVLITEAAAKSGTMHTASFALEQGRPVMAIPGNITSPMSQGTNNLIKSGATPVTELSDILLALNLQATSLGDSEVFGSSRQESILLELLKQGITDATELLNLTGLEVSDFNQTLTMLEIDGKIRPLGAGHWTLKLE